MIPIDEMLNVYVYGEVRTPGVIPYLSSKKITLLQAIAQAGGPTEWAKKSKVVIKRKDKKTGKEMKINVNLKSMIGGKTRRHRARGGRRRHRPMSSTRLRGIIPWLLKHPENPKRGLLAQLQHYWHVLLKWKWTIAVFFVTAVAAATVYSFMVSPVYTATGSVWIDDDPNILPFEDVQTIGAGSTMASYSGLLRSRTLASDTIDRLKLYEDDAFAGKPKKGRETARSGGPDLPGVAYPKIPGQRVRFVQ